MPISGPAFNEVIKRWKTLNDFGLHADNLSTLPAVPLKNLARYAGMTSVFNIARMSQQKRGAVLVAWETLARLKNETSDESIRAEMSATSPGKGWLKSSRLSVKFPDPQTIIFMTKLNACNNLMVIAVFYDNKSHII